MVVEISRSPEDSSSGLNASSAGVLSGGANAFHNLFGRHCAAQKRLRAIQPGRGDFGMVHRIQPLDQIRGLGDVLQPAHDRRVHRGRIGAAHNGRGLAIGRGREELAILGRRCEFQEIQRQRHVFRRGRDHVTRGRALNIIRDGVSP